MDVPRLPDHNDFGLDLEDAPEKDESLFVGRERELDYMREHLLFDGEPQEQKILTLTGPSGVGKTQLAIAFARRHKGAFDSVFWLNTKPHRSLIPEFYCLSERMYGWRSAVGVDDGAIWPILCWLSQEKNSRWLLVFDNYNKPDDLKDGEVIEWGIERYIPHCSHGSILITSREPLGIGKKLRLGNFTDSRDSLAVVAKYSGREGLLEDPNIIKLAKQFEGFPLTLAHMGSYIKNSTDDSQRLFSDYAASSQAYEGIADSTLQNEDRKLRAILDLSFRKLEAQNQCAANLLRLFAFFNSEGLSLEMLQCGALGAPSWFQELVTSEKKFLEAMSCLCSHSFAAVHRRSATYCINERVHDWTLDRLNQHIDQPLLLLAINCVANSVEGGHEGLNSRSHFKEGSVSQQSIIRHAMRFQQWRIKNNLPLVRIEVIDSGNEESGIIKAGAIRSFPDAAHSLAVLFLYHYKYEEAKSMCKLALEQKERVLGSGHASTLSTVNALGNILSISGETAEAEKSIWRALTGRQKALGYDHPTTIDSVQSLGEHFLKINKLPDAEKWLKRALKGREKALGWGHESTLFSSALLAETYETQERFVEAEELYQRALKDQIKLFGLVSLTSSARTYGLKQLYQRLGKLTELEDLLQLELSSLKRALGLNHPKTLQLLRELCDLFRQQRRYPEAEEALRQRIDGYMKTFGPNARSTLTAVMDLGMLYYTWGKFDKADEKLQFALKKFEKVLKPDHDYRLGVAACIGEGYARQGKLQEAESWLQRSLQDHEKKLGMNNIKVLFIAESLGCVLGEQGKIAEAEELLQRSLVGLENQLGPDDEDTLDCVMDLGRLYQNNGDLAKAEELHQRALDGLGKKAGSHADKKLTLVATADMGRLRLKQKRLEDAEEKLQEALKGLESFLIPEHYLTLEVLADMGNLRSQQGRIVESEELYRRANVGIRVYGPGSQNVHRRLSRL